MKIHTPFFFVDDCTDGNSSGWNYLRSTNNLSKSNSRHCRHLLEMSYKQVNSWNTELKWEDWVNECQRKTSILAFDTWQCTFQFTWQQKIKCLEMLTPGSALQNLCTFLFMKYACYIKFKIISLFEHWIKLRNLRWIKYSS